MESGSLGMDSSSASDPRDCSLAFLRRRAWAQSRDSTWQESEAGSCGPQGPQQSPRNGEERPADVPGQVPNDIASWLIECRTPIGASLDDQSASPSRGPLKNGCSFEDDLSLGAEANHLQSNINKPESHFGLADQKRHQYKERGRSMNSTGSGKSSTVSSVSELLDLYEEDPEEVLMNLGFGREEPDLASKVPSRFFNNSSTARGIDIKVYLGAQLQRMEVENPNYALTSRFRQIEVLTTVANEFFQLYSQVSGQPVQCISSKGQGGEGGEGGPDESSPILKRTSSARNVAKFLKKTISKHNLLAAAPETPDAATPPQQAHLNGHGVSDHALNNGPAHAGPEPDGCTADPDHQVETVNQKPMRKKDSCFLATVTEETNGDVGDESPEQSRTDPAANGEHQPESPDAKPPNEGTEEGTQVVKEEQEVEKNLTSTPEKAPPTLAPPQLAQLRTENADSFDMEEIQSNEDEALPPRPSRTTDLLRTVSQQSDSSGFAEEPSADSNSYLKVQDSSDSCDSETTVTSHPSLDAATPLAMDQPAFELPDVREEEAGPGVDAGADGSGSPRGEDKHDGSSEELPLYTAHHLPRNKEEVENEDLIDPGSKPEPEIPQSPPPTEPEHTQNQSAPEQEPQHAQNQTETSTDPELPTSGVEDEEERRFSYSSSSSSSPIIGALMRAKQKRLTRGGQLVEPQTPDLPQSPGRGRGRGRGRGGIPLQRSSSLPSSFLSPTRVVSSVRIQFGRGQASCTQPRFSFKYTQDAEGEEDEEDKEGQTSCLSTLIINPASSSDSQPLRVPAETPVPPKPIPRYLLRSAQSLQSSSPPPEWSPGGPAPSWSTQSVPDLSSNQQQPGHFQQNLGSSQNLQNPAQMMFRYPSPYPSQYLTPSPSLSPNPYPLPLHHPLQYPSMYHPYGSLPNLLHYHNLPHHSSQTNFYQPTTPPMPQHGGSTPSQQVHGLHPGPMPPPHPAYTPLYGHPSPCHGSLYASPYLGYHGYNMNPHLGFPHPLPQCPSLVPDHGLHLGFPPPAPAPGFVPGLEHGLHQGFTPQAAAPGPNQGPSSTEMQLRRVLHDIKGTVQSLCQNRPNTFDSCSEHRAAQPGHPSLAEFQQKKQSLNLFRSQMVDLEQSISRQQALVYKHLSPADRMEVEQLQSLRLAVREELQELEQQLEDRLEELTSHTQHGDFHRDTVDGLSTTSALRAMEPVSDLLREQLLLQSELSYDARLPSTGHSSTGHSSTGHSSTGHSSRSSSPGQGDGEQRGGVYRASININPVPPPRPNAHSKVEEEESDAGGAPEEEEEVELEEGAAGGEFSVGNLQQLIREIRESVAQEVRQEIYGELLAAVSPRRSPLPGRQHPL